MADQLRPVRMEFVEKVSIENISKLLDGLLKDRVFNDGEKEIVVEKKITRGDKARSLFDMVIRKGDAASRKMMVHLERIDQKLYAELSLPSGQAAQPAASPPDAQSRSITAVEKFWRTKQNDASVYPVTKASYRSRIALLITNIRFSHENKRNGAEKDEENMQKLLISLGYEVVKYTNCTGQAIENALTDFAKHPKLNETDSVFVVIMSHGKLGKILGVNWKDCDEEQDEFPINDIFTLLGSEKCPKLLNKPKIIVVQACRGGKKGCVFVTDAPIQADDVSQSGTAEEFEEDTIQLVHREKDFIPLLSCTPDTVSYRHSQDGSLLIQYIVDIFKADSHQDHIFELFRKVMQRFEGPIARSCMQMPTIDRFTLTKNFYLFPGLVDTNQ